MRSGFRYHEAEAILEEAPTSLFFSTFEMTDAFPAPVHPLSEFPKHALREGVTDAYGVFEYFLEGLVGMHPTDQRDPHFMEGPDMGAFLRRSGIRLHGSIYPGGGLKVTPEGLDRVRQLTGRLATAFSYVPEVLAAVPQVVEVSPAFTETRFYAYDACRWDSREKLVCLFAADAPPRKGADVVLDAFRALPAERFHLHVVGPHLHRRGELPEDLATFHGWLSPERLRDLHREVHVFLSPVSAEPAGPNSDRITDGFPTQAAADAISSGCLLVSANPAGDRRVLLPGVHYLECDPDPDRLRQLVCAARRRARTAAPDRRCRVRPGARADGRQARDRGEAPPDGLRSTLGLTERPAPRTAGIGWPKPRPGRRGTPSCDQSSTVCTGPHERTPVPDRSRDRSGPARCCPSTFVRGSGDVEAIEVDTGAGRPWRRR